VARITTGRCHKCKIRLVYDGGGGGGKISTGGGGSINGSDGGDCVSGSKGSGEGSSGVIVMLKHPTVSNNNKNTTKQIAITFFTGRILSPFKDEINVLA